MSDEKVLKHPSSCEVLSLDHSAYVTKQFYAFYKEIIAIKQELLEKIQLDKAISIEEQQKLIKNTQARLVTKLERLFEEARYKDWMHGRDYYREAQYIMAVLADEIFINLDWFGKDFWQSNLLEYEIFKTNNAGDLFFEKLEHLLSETNPLNANLAEIYLMALALGFQGRYRGMNNALKIISEYKRELFTFICGKEYETKEISGPNFTQAYSHTISKRKVKLLPIIDKFLMLIIAFVALYLIGNQIIWQSHTKTAKESANEITQIIEQMAYI